jgi:hypothetical protein
MSDPSGACGQLARAGDDIMRERIEALAAELAEASKSSTSRHGRSEPIYSRDLFLDHLIAGGLGPRGCVDLGLLQLAPTRRFTLLAGFLAIVLSKSSEPALIPRERLILEQCIGTPASFCPRTLVCEQGGYLPNQFMLPESSTIGARQRWHYRLLVDD